MGEPYLRIYDDEYLPSELQDSLPIPRYSSRTEQGDSHESRTTSERYNFSYVYRSRPIEPIQESPLSSPSYQSSSTQTEPISSNESRDTGNTRVQWQRSSTSSSSSGSRSSYESAQTS